MSNLFIATVTCDTPSDLISIVCSRVCPPASNPASNSPIEAFTTIIATSAYYNNLVININNGHRLQV